MSFLDSPRTAIPPLRKPSPNHPHSNLPLPPPLLSPSPLEYPYRQFLPLGESYTEESIHSCLSSSEREEKERCAYRVKVSQSKPSCPFSCRVSGRLCESADEGILETGEKRKERCGGVYGS